MWRSTIWPPSTSSPTICQPTSQWSRECKADIWYLKKKKKTDSNKHSQKSWEKVNNKNERGARPNQFELENEKRPAVCLRAQWGRPVACAWSQWPVSEINKTSLFFILLISDVSLLIAKVGHSWWTWRDISETNMIRNFENCAIELQ